MGTSVCAVDFVFVSKYLLDYDGWRRCVGDKLWNMIFLKIRYKKGEFKFVH